MPGRIAAVNMMFGVTGPIEKSVILNQAPTNIIIKLKTARKSKNFRLIIIGDGFINGGLGEVYDINSSVMGPGFHLVTKIKFNKKTSPEGKVDEYFKTVII